MTFIITQSCCNDASCVAVCPVDCIHPAPDDPDFATAEMLYINPDEAARRARKYGGSLVTATQNGDDYFTSAQMESALKCSDWTFLLRQKPESIELLARTGRFSMDEPKKRLLNSLRMEPGVFSECYITSPIGEGVARIILDPFSHLLFSNKLDDNAPLDALRRQGLSIDDAITELLRRRGYTV